MEQNDTIISVNDNANLLDDVHIEVVVVETGDVESGMGVGIGECQLKGSLSMASFASTGSLFEDMSSSGKHLIADIQDIGEVALLDDVVSVQHLFDTICEKYQYSILQKIHHRFEPHGFTLIYMLSESHLSIHTFPEKQYAAVDLYTCRQYTNNRIQNDILEILLSFFDAGRVKKYILDRDF